MKPRPVVAQASRLFVSIRTGETPVPLSGSWGPPIPKSGAHWGREPTRAYARATASWTAVGEGPGAHTAFRFGSALVTGASFQSGVSPIPRQPPQSKTLRAIARFMESLDLQTWTRIGATG